MFENPREMYFEFLIRKTNGVEDLRIIVSRKSIVAIEEVYPDDLDKQKSSTDNTRCAVVVYDGEKNIRYRSIEKYKKLLARLYNQPFSGI